MAINRAARLENIGAISPPAGLNKMCKLQINTAAEPIRKPKSPNLDA
jgi:hypothetical protein